MVVEIVSAIADALDYANEQGVVHRFVNPSNILLSNWESRRRRIMLTGFGLPRRPDETNSLTRANLGIGTVSYAAPEQLMDDSIDGRADQYGLACTAFHLLTGSPPFAHMNPAVVASKHLNESPPRPGDVRPELAYFDMPFARALMKHPTERFRHCRDFAKALDSKEGLGPYSPKAGAAALFTTPLTNGAVPTEPPNSAPPVAAEPDPPTAEVDEPPTPREALPEADVRDPDDPLDDWPEADVRDPDDPFDDWPEADVRDTIAAPNGLPEADFDDAGTPADADVWTAANDDEQAASNRRRLLHTGGLGLAILTVAVGGILGVMALRSASESHDAPTDVETPTPLTTVPPARLAPTTAIPPPMVKAPPPVTTTPPKPTPSLAATTTPPVTTSARPETTVAQTTRTHSPSPTTPTPPTGLDTRPAVGMPCGAPGSTATSNLGGPVACVDTPGGSAWEPPGG
jgi:serine/threonine-protein kinase